MPQVHYDLGLLYLFAPSIPGMTPAQQVQAAQVEIKKYKGTEKEYLYFGPSTSKALTPYWLTWGSGLMDLKITLTTVGLPCLSARVKETVPTAEPANPDKSR